MERNEQEYQGVKYCLGKNPIDEERVPEMERQAIDDIIERVAWQFDNGSESGGVNTAKFQEHYGWLRPY